MSVLPFPARSNVPPMREAFRQGIVDGWNALVDVGKIDKASVNVMIGFLSGASIAFRVVGDEPAASACETAAQRLVSSWHQYEPCITKLIEELDGLGIFQTT